MQKRFLWFNLILNMVVSLLLLFLAANYRTVIYLVYQAQGQISLLCNTTSISEFEKQEVLSQKQKSNLALIQAIKKYSVDSLGYKPTENYTSVYDQRNETSLWVITASKPFAFEPFLWKFPIIGSVSYKGFFKKELAVKERNHLLFQGYDVDMRGVSAWSTLGWLDDPILSNMLNRSKGSLCNLMFHELFHATYYAKGSVDLNENLANFVAHKATCRFLKNDSCALGEYLRAYEDNIIFDKFILRQLQYLKNYYQKTARDSSKYLLKLRALFNVTDSIDKLVLNNQKPYLSRKSEILNYKNAYFVSFIQYDSKQDSLEEVFNKIYKGNIKNLVRYLKLD